MQKKPSGLRFFFILLLISLPFLYSCMQEKSTAVLWTDQSDFALYSEFFNASQDEYKIEIRYFESPARELVVMNGNKQHEYPDIVAGSWLKSTSTRTLFRPLDSFLREGDIPPENFYAPLLALGKIEGKQYLLPVSFNMPALIFTREEEQKLSNPFTIDFEEARRLGMAYNQQRNGVFTRIGFSPAWDDEFLFITADLFNTGFREAAPLAWDNTALEQAMVYVRNWIEEVNSGFQAEDDFVFKYFYEPLHRLVSQGRILFAYMNSAAIFTLAPERRQGLGFRWISENDSIPLIEGSVYYGIPKGGKAGKAAAAFTRWFFNQETQRQMLERSRDFRLLETSFGIAGGFSAMRPVTEQIFPLFYPSLLGHLPPGDFFSPPNILPLNWTRLKEKVILPYLHERIRQDSREDIRPLERRISEWNRINRE
ncbi:MAG: hypothetical protein LBC57_08295 [Treponema sp.]|nr:hypothetical protein [Treponema sp.]